MASTFAYYWRTSETPGEGLVPFSSIGNYNDSTAAQFRGVALYTDPAKDADVRSAPDLFGAVEGIQGKRVFIEAMRPVMTKARYRIQVSEAFRWRYGMNPQGDNIDAAAEDLYDVISDLISRNPSFLGDFVKSRGGTQTPNHNVDRGATRDHESFSHFAVEKQFPVPPQSLRGEVTLVPGVGTFAATASSYIENADRKFAKPPWMLFAQGKGLHYMTDWGKFDPDTGDYVGKARLAPNTPLGEYVVLECPYSFRALAFELSNLIGGANPQSNPRQVEIWGRNRGDDAAWTLLAAPPPFEWSAAMDSVETMTVPLDGASLGSFSTYAMVITGIRGFIATGLPPGTSNNARMADARFLRDPRFPLIPVEPYVPADLAVPPTAFAGRLLETAAGTFSVQQSSFLDNVDGSYPGWKAMNGKTTHADVWITNWGKYEEETGEYKGDDARVDPKYPGEWLRFNSPYKFVLGSYSVAQWKEPTGRNSIRESALYGREDSGRWTRISPPTDHSTILPYDGSEAWDTVPVGDFRENIRKVKPYSSYALVVNKVAAKGANGLRLKGLRFRARGATRLPSEPMTDTTVDDRSLGGTFSVSASSTTSVVKYGPHLAFSGDAAKVFLTAGGVYDPATGAYAGSAAMPPGVDVAGEYVELKCPLKAFADEVAVAHVSADAAAGGISWQASPKTSVLYGFDDEAGEWALVRSLTHAWKHASATYQESTHALASKSAYSRFLLVITSTRGGVGNTATYAAVPELILKASRFDLNRPTPRPVPLTKPEGPETLEL